MAEIVEYRVERTIEELNLLVEFGLFEKGHAKEILAKREDFEYALRRRTKDKLSLLKYIKFEVNLLESIDNYRKTIVKKSTEPIVGEQTEEEKIERRIFLLQAKKLNEVLRTRSAHISALFRKLVKTYQFDKKMWLAYIDFAKSRRWNTRVGALYWRLLRVAGDDEDIWIAAANHEVDLNKQFDVARGLFLRALRHHPASYKTWFEYFKMELKFMDVVDRRARIIFKTLQKSGEAESSDIWAEPEKGEGTKDSTVDDKTNGDDDEDEETVLDTETEAEKRPEVMPINEDDAIISGHLPKVIYDNATDSLKAVKDFMNFVILVLKQILSDETGLEGIRSVRDHIFADLRKRRTELDDPRVPRELVDNLDNLEIILKFERELNPQNHTPTKKLKKADPSKMDILYECYETKGLDESRRLYQSLVRSVHNRTLSLYVGMIQIELWQLATDTSESQLSRIRSIYDQALAQFGKTKPKLWYEYLQFEQDYAKSLEDFERINQIYMRAQATLLPSKVDKVVEKYTLIQLKSASNVDIEYSDYSDLED